MTLSSHAIRRQALRLIGEVLPARATAPVLDRLLHPRRLERRVWEEPAAAAARRVRFRSGLSGLRWGTQGPVVVALHGWEGRATQFRFIAEGLVRAGRRVIALEGPAHGDSPGHVAHPRLFAEALVETVAELVTEVGAVESVVGHSMGAAATAYALSQGALSVERAVLVAGPSSYEGVIRRAAQFVGLGPRATAHLLREMAARTGLAPAALDIAAAAQRVDVPTLVVHDRDDDAVDFANAERLMPVLSDGRLLATQALGHWRVLTDADTVARVVGFLTSTSAVRHAA